MPTFSKTAEADVADSEHVFFFSAVFERFANYDEPPLNTFIAPRSRRASLRKRIYNEIFSEFRCTENPVAVSNRPRIKSRAVTDRPYKEIR
jgi:hypothetical protein